MTLDLAQWAQQSQGLLWQGLIVLLRIGAMMALLPAFGEKSVPLRVKLGLTLAFGAIVVPAVSATIAPPQGGTAAIAACGAEVVAGLFFGAAVRMLVLALEMAGTIAAQSTSLSQLFGGTAGADPQPALGQILLVGGLALAALLGLHVRLAAYMIESYRLVPAGTMIAGRVVSEVGLAEVGRAFGLAFTLSAPFALAALIYNVTLGVINRAMPQLMVAFIGAPAITLGAMGLMLLAAPLALSVWSDALYHFLAAPFGQGP
ncbi:MAG: type III secretion protein [Limimaricola sp.]|uniref:flagellar biosynthetic protein FliR n=1 Tax=Limimaricola sp. TaxID=2211665 RepID=UPI001D91E544|nr:flagellar biosynthetic protein FliR [Limimaricola sp.]MBI1417344.1 type III secretion protein [Limimaricola sp.]